MASERSDESTGTSKFLDQTIQSAAKFGIAHSVLDTDQIRARFPQFNLVGDERGYYEPTMGFLRPELCIESQLALAKTLGAEIHTQEKLLEFAATANGIRLRTSADQYDVDHLVLSVGPWIASVIPEFASLFKVYRQLLFWFDLDAPIENYLPGKFPVFIWAFSRHHDNFVYGFPAIDGPGGGVKIASEQRSVESEIFNIDSEVKRDEVDEIYRKYIQMRLPGVSNRCLNAVTCLYTCLPDSGFVVDFHPKHSNVMIVSPCSGHGFKHSAAIGEAVAELVVDGKSSIELSAFRLTRF